MSVVFMDGFDTVYGSEFPRKWTVVNNANSIGVDPSYAYGSKGMGVKFGDWASKTLQANYSSSIIGFYGNPVTTAASTLFSVYDQSTDQLSLVVDSANHLQIKRSTTVLATSVNTLLANNWIHIEFKFVIHNTAGLIQVKVNGVDWIALTTNLNTRMSTNNYWNTIRFNGTTWYIDDLYILDTTQAPNNDFLGPCKILTLLPEAPGYYTQWASNWLDNFANLDRVGTHDDTVFVQSNNVSDADTFKMTNCPSGTVKAVSTNIVVRQDPGLARQVARLLRQGSTDRLGSGFVPTVNYSNVQELFDTNPATGNAWTPSEINASEFGYKNVS